MYQLKIILLICVTILLGACGGKKDTSATYGPAPKAQNVLLVVIEALPAARLGCYGGDKSLTPNMDRIAKQGIVFEHFHSAAPWTMPSFGSIISGNSPPLHHAGRYKPSKEDPTKLSAEMFGMAKDIPFLPEALKKAGVYTSIIVNNAFVSEDYGFKRGWNHFDQRFAGFTGYRNGEATTQDALRVLRQNGDKSHFMLLHYFDPHVPYRPEKYYMEKFHRGEQGRITMRGINQLKDMRKRKFWPNKKEQQYLRGLHDAEIAYTDNEIGRLIDGMDSLNLLENTWIIITADHGEELFEHGDFEHGHRYEGEVTRVPLIIRPPRGSWHRGERVPYAARHIDLAPTILQRFGVDVPKAMEGSDLLPLVSGEEKEHRPTYIAFTLTGTPAHAFFDGRYKIIQSLDTKENYMYDLKTDPLEKKKLGKSHAEFARMKQQIEAVRNNFDRLAKEGAPAPDDQKISDDVLNSLRSLGYIE